MEGTNFLQTQGGIIQIPAGAMQAQQQQIVQTQAAPPQSPPPAQAQQAQAIQIPAAVPGMQGGNIVMVVPGSASSLQALQRIPLPGAELLEEEPLYVNAKQYHRILKRRQARARLEAEGRIPKERRVTYFFFFSYRNVL